MGSLAAGWALSSLLSPCVEEFKEQCRKAGFVKRNGAYSGMNVDSLPCTAKACCLHQSRGCPVCDVLECLNGWGLGGVWVEPGWSLSPTRLPVTFVGILEVIWHVVHMGGEAQVHEEIGVLSAG